MRNIALILLISLSLVSCNKTNDQEIINDIISYNLKVLNREVNNCKIIDRDASCAGKSEAYIISCDGNENWFKWDRLRNFSGGYIVEVCILPQNFTNYRCNPWLNTKKQYKAHKKEGLNWIPEKYTDD